MPTILATRLGFSFQDRYACYIFLKEFRDGTVRKFFTDYPAQGQQSFDIVMMKGKNLQDAEEHVYEVKTGEKFRRDSATKKDTEIKDVIRTFIDYSKDKPKLRGFITYTRGEERPITIYKGNADILLKSRKLDEIARKAADDLIVSLNMDELKEQKDALSLFRHIQFDPLPYSSDQTWTRLNEDVQKHIEEIARSVNGDSQADLLPASHLANILYGTIQQYAGTKEDTAPLLTHAILEFMILRSILSNHRPEESPARLREKARKEVTESMLSHFKVQDLVGVSLDSLEGSASESTEGEAVSV